MANRNDFASSLAATPQILHVKPRRAGIWVGGALALAGIPLLWKVVQPAAEPPVYRLAEGQRLVYALEYRNSARADFSPLLPEEQTRSAPSTAFASLRQEVQSQVNGQLVVEVVEHNATGRVLACRLENARVSLRSGSEEAPEQAEIVQRDLTLPVFVRVTPQGRVEDVRFDPTTQSASQSFARALLGSFQFVVPTPAETNSSATKSWETTEIDTAGRYVARYEVASEDESSTGADIAEASGGLFLKTKLRYLPQGKTTSTEAAPAQTVAPDTRILARFAVKDGFVTALRGSEKQSVELAGQAVANSHTNFAFRLVERTTLDLEGRNSLQSANARSAAQAQPVSLFVAPDADEVRQATRQSTLGEATLGTLLSELAQHQKAGETENAALYLKFRALAELQPASCAFLGQLLAIAPASSLTFRVLSEALAAVDSPQAQDALVFTVRARPRDEDALLRLLPALGMAKTPTNVAQNVLHELASSSPNVAIASTAQLALGNMARSLAQPGTPDAFARSNRIVDALLTQLENARSTGEQQQLLLTLGNTGSPRALTALRRYAQNETAALRATAVGSLRFIASPDAETLLLHALTSDAKPEVRLEAAQALGFRTPSRAALQSQKRALQSDANASVRLALLSNLWTARTEIPQFKNLVEQLAAHDPAPEVRQAAAQIKEQQPEGSAAFEPR